MLILILVLAIKFRKTFFVIHGCRDLPPGGGGGGGGGGRS